MFDKNIYKMTVVCCNYAVASYLWSVTMLMAIDAMLLPGNHWRSFYWRKYQLCGIHTEDGKHERQ